MILFKKPSYNSRLTPALHSYFATSVKLKENSFNFGETTYLKIRAVRQAAKRYV